MIAVLQKGFRTGTRMVDGHCSQGVRRQLLYACTTLQLFSAPGAGTFGGLASWTTRQRDGCRFSGAFPAP